MMLNYMRTKRCWKLKQIFSKLILILYISGCGNTTPRNIVLDGEYESEPVSKMKVGYGQFISKRLYAKNNKLILKAADATFELNTCGSIIKGRFYQQEDTLVLLVYQHTRKSDSLTYTSDTVPLDTTRYHIKNQEMLIQTWVLTSGRFSGYTDVNCLKKK